MYVHTSECVCTTSSYIVHVLCVCACFVLLILTSFVYSLWYVMCNCVNPHFLPQTLSSWVSLTLHSESERTSKDILPMSAEDIRFIRVNTTTRTSWKREAEVIQGDTIQHHWSHARQWSSRLSEHTLFLVSSPGSSQFFSAEKTLKNWEEPGDEATLFCLH